MFHLFYIQGQDRESPREQGLRKRKRKRSNNTRSQSHNLEFRITPKSSVNGTVLVATRPKRPIEFPKHGAGQVCHQNIEKPVAESSSYATSDLEHPPKNKRIHYDGVKSNILITVVKLCRFPLADFPQFLVKMNGKRHRSILKNAFSALIATV